MKIEKLDWSEVLPTLYSQSAEIKTAFEDIITKTLNEVSVPRSQKQQCFIHLLGIPGAGKTTFWLKNKEAFADYVFISFDKLMQMLPAYRSDVEKLGLEKAFARWEIPARIAGYELLCRAMEQKKNIFFDHGGSPNLHLAIMNEAKKEGYQTKMYYLQCNPATAQKRVKIREKQIQRHTSKDLITNRYPLIIQRAEQFKTIVDEFIEVD